jgi:ferredoxin
MQVIGELDDAGYEVWAPAVRDGVVVARRFQDGDALPIGYISDQAPGAYQLVPTSRSSRFEWAVGPQPWKPLLHPASVTTMAMSQPDPVSTVAVSVASRPRKPLALFGMRPCDIAAVDKLDQVLLDSPPTGEPVYTARRADAFFVVVNCGVPAATCFCSSVDTGPHVDSRSTSHDLEVTELVGERSTDEPEYLLTAISRRGAAVIDGVAARTDASPVSDAHLERQRSQRDRAETEMRRHLPSDRLAAALIDSHHSPRWKDAAQACLACGNCTAVCPTCFCTTISDVGDLAGTHVERRREWESCFSLEFSRLGTSSVRSSVAARYRQWMTHKLGTWHDQFGESGCVGCGRCTTWCPVGIDFVDVARGFTEDGEGGVP